MTEKPTHDKAITKAKRTAKRDSKTQDSPAADGKKPAGKTAKLLRLLQRPTGATLAELQKSAGWQSHSVRGFISGVVKKRMGLLVATAQRENGDRFYLIKGQ